MYYRLVFNKNSKSANALKIVLLIAGLFCDMAALFGLILAILGSYIYLLMFFGSLVFSILFRVIALRLVYNIECKLQDNELMITKIYPNKSKVVLKEKLNEIEISYYNSESSTQNLDNAVNLLTSDSEQYIVSSQNITVLCNLDKYIYASILKGSEI